LSKKLRLLLDECIPASFARQIGASSGVSSVEVINAKHRLENKGTSDADVMAYATRERRILVTVEGRINEKDYTICTHEGIIVVNATRRHEAEKANLFARFMQSGHRSKSGHAVTKLRLERSERLERGPTGSVQSTVFDL